MSQLVDAFDIRPDRRPFCCKQQIFSLKKTFMASRIGLLFLFAFLLSTVFWYSPFALLPTFLLTSQRQGPRIRVDLGSLTGSLYPAQSDPKRSLRERLAQQYKLGETDRAIIPANSQGNVWSKQETVPGKQGLGIRTRQRAVYQKKGLLISSGTGYVIYTDRESSKDQFNREGQTLFLQEQERNDSSSVTLIDWEWNREGSLLLSSFQFYPRS